MQAITNLNKNETINSKNSLAAAMIAESRLLDKRDRIMNENEKEAIRQNNMMNQIMSLNSSKKQKQFDDLWNNRTGMNPTGNYVDIDISPRNNNNFW